MYAEHQYPHATYVRDDTGGLVFQPSKDVPPIRWSSIKDPHIPGALPEGAHPIHVSLHAGDAVSSLLSAFWPTSEDAFWFQLYLPAGWWHHVRQGGTTEEPTIAVNWWYDVEMRGMSWVWLSFLRGRDDKDDDELEDVA
jgi:jumonji domain-containing protein 7